MSLRRAHKGGMQDGDKYVEDWEDEDPWPRAAFASKVPQRGKTTARGFKPAPAKFVIKREPASQPSRGTTQVRLLLCLWQPSGENPWTRIL